MKDFDSVFGLLGRITLFFTFLQPALAFLHGRTRLLLGVAENYRFWCLSEYKSSLNISTASIIKQKTQ
ncbi:hypothetical protein BDV29DRAFT_179630 [Aspergillus leporis]|uniref:Uncharacterized protein n=1 Tax=Aspergillus leporis TaxID=41062 RepID=A0A5N5WVI2_9EURO|nr:hypothetical protein BDV29DRAFT_179630 [Aspergillus leporis]